VVCVYGSNRYGSRRSWETGNLWVVVIWSSLNSEWKRMVFACHRALHLVWMGRARDKSEGREGEEMYRSLVMYKQNLGGCFLLWIILFFSSSVKLFSCMSTWRSAEEGLVEASILRI